MVLGIVDAAGTRVLAYGNSGRPERPALDGRTRFEIGSVAKTFTGILLADMALAGIVSERDTVGALFPPDIVLDNGVQRATLESLATHASGLPRLAVEPWWIARALSDDPYRGSSVDDVMRSVARVPAWLVRPDEELRYSNLGYALLGALLERRGGEPYQALLRRRVLEPLGLRDIATMHSPSIDAEMAQGHGPGGRPLPFWHLDGYAPAGGLIASADQLLRYLAHNLAATVPAVADAQRVRRTFASGPSIGLAWLHSSIGGRRLVWHNGGTGGFASFVGFLPDERVGIVVLANGPGNVDGLVRRLLDRDAPPLPAPRADVTGIAITLFLLCMGPVTIGLALRRLARRRGGAPGVRAVDRLDALNLALGAALALLIVQRVGAWSAVPYAAWWIALAAALIAGGALLVRARDMPWLRGSRFRIAAQAAGITLQAVLVIAIVAA